MKNVLFLVACLSIVACTKPSENKSNSNCPDLAGEYHLSTDPTQTMTWSKDAKGNLVGTDNGGPLVVDGKPQTKITEEGDETTTTVSCSNNTIIATETKKDGQALKSLTLQKTASGFTITGQGKTLEYVKVGGAPPMGPGGPATAATLPPHQAEQCPALAGNYHSEKEPDHKLMIAKNAKGELVIGVEAVQLTVNGSPAHDPKENSTARAVCSRNTIVMAVEKEGRTSLVTLTPNARGFSFGEAPEVTNFIRD